MSAEEVGKGSRSFFRIAVDDDGPGLPQEARTEVLTQRGRRLDESKPGSGLGISIVSDLAHLYEGRLELTRRASEGCVRARLPARRLVRQPTSPHCLLVERPEGLCEVRCALIENSSLRG